MVQTNGLDHVVLHVSDVGRSKAFYTEILGMSAYREDDEQVFLRTGHQGVALFKKRGEVPPTAGNDLNHLALTIGDRDVRDAKGRSEAHGVTVSGRPERTAAFTSATRTGTASS